MADSDDDDLSEEDMADAWGAALAEQGAGGDDDDDLAAAWGAALEEQGAGSSDDMAAQWAAMIDDSEPDLENATRGADRVLNQEEIDNLLGFNIEDTYMAAVHFDTMPLQPFESAAKVFGSHTKKRGQSPFFHGQFQLIRPRGTGSLAQDIFGQPFQ